MSIITEAVENINRKLLLVSNNIGLTEGEKDLIEQCYWHLNTIAKYAKAISSNWPDVHKQANKEANHA